MIKVDIRQVSRNNQWLGQLEALEWAYEVAMTYDESKVAGSIKESISMLKDQRGDMLDFPYMAAKLYEQRKPKE